MYLSGMEEPLLTETNADRGIFNWKIQEALNYD
jgi:hypothetical protein